MLGLPGASAVRAGLLAAMALLLVTPAVSSAAPKPAGPPKPPVLAGTLTLVGDRSASMLVRVPRTAGFVNEIGDPSAPPGMTADKGGPSGFALISEKPGGPQYIGSTAPGGFKLKYRISGFFSPQDGGYRIPAGNYRLYLVTEHPRTKLTIRFRDLGGAQTLKPTMPAQGFFETPKPDREGTVAKFAYSIGDTSELHRDRAMFLMSALVRHDIHAESVHTWCYYPAGKRDDGAYCPSPYASNGPSIVSFETIDGLTHGMFVSGAVTKPGGVGQTGIGYSLTTTTPAVRIGYHNMWVALEDPPE